MKIIWMKTKMEDMEQMDIIYSDYYSIDPLEKLKITLATRPVAPESPIRANAYGYRKKVFSFSAAFVIVPLVPPRGGFCPDSSPILFPVSGDFPADVADQIGGFPPRSRGI